MATSGSGSSFLQYFYERIWRGDLSEMPHLETGNGDDVIDLCIEKYPIPQDEKKRLFHAFKTTGFVGKLKDMQPEQYAFFSDKDGVRLASPTEETTLPHLPDDWENFLRKS